MGKEPTAAETVEMKRKKKGRPFKNLSLSTLPKTTLSNSTSRRSTRRNPMPFNSPSESEFDDEDEREEKKVKLVVRLPQSDETAKAGEKHPQQPDGHHSRDSDSCSGSESEDRDGCSKKLKIDGVDCGSDDGGFAQEKEVDQATATPQKGLPLESGPTNPLPDKKFLVFILDRLQKKDTYAAFSQPVDPKELPDYYEIIEHPMDFGTVRKKLDSGSYWNLKDFEADVLLICSNALLYNASHTIYYRQARSIQELAKREFEHLKHEGDDGVPQPKVVRRGRPPSSKIQKKPIETSPVDHAERVSTEVSSSATLATGEDKDRTTESNSYNLRKNPALFRSKSTDPFLSSQRLRNGENYSETDWNSEFPALILRADMKYGKKNFIVDENKRDSYTQSLSLSHDSPHFPNAMKRLVPVGFQEAFAYARSLARYASNLGPVAWKMASKKIEAILPPGVEYGLGWVGDNEAFSKPFSYSDDNQKLPNSNHTGGCNSSELEISPVSDIRSTVVLETVGKTSNSQIDVAGNMQPSVSYRNGFTRNHAPAMVNHVSPQERKVSESRNKANGKAEMPKFEQHWLSLPEQQRYLPSIPPDLNVQVPAGSPSSSVLIGSPKQPDFALQL